MYVIYPELFLGFSIMILLIFGIKYCTVKPAIGICIISLILLVSTGYPDFGVYFGSGFQFNSWVYICKGALLLGGLSILIMAKPTQSEIPILILLVLLGSIILVSANNLLNVYICLELQTLAIFILVAKRRGSIVSAEGGLKYFVLGALSSGLYLFGTGVIYAYSGSIDFAVINTAFTFNELLNLGKSLITVALLFKLAVAPFHFWAPDVYEGASLNIVALLVIVPKIAIFAVIVQLWPDPQILVLGSMLSMIIGGIGAINQTKIKRLFAYSGILNMGFIIAGLSLSSFEGVQASLIYLIIYLITAVLGFSVLSLFNKERLTLELVIGLSRHNSVVAYLWGITFFSFAGIPPLLGFFAKWIILLSIIRENYTLLAIVAVVSSVVAGVYYVRLVMLAYFKGKQNNSAWFAVLGFQAPKYSFSLLIGISSYLILLGIICPNLILEITKWGVYLI